MIKDHDIRRVAQFGRALRSGRRGRKFESCHADPINKGFDNIGTLIFFLKGTGLHYILFHMKNFTKLLIWILTGILVFVLGVRLYFRLPVHSYYSSSEKGFLIPDSDNGFIAQGLAYSEPDDCFLVTGYMKDHSASPIYVIDKATGKMSKKILLLSEDGSDYCGHCGGLTVHGDLVYVAGSEDHCIYVYSYEDILKGSSGNVRCLGSIPVCEDINVAFVESTEDAIYAGEFYKDPEYPTPESHKIMTAAGDLNQALMVGYHFSDDDNALFSVDPVPFAAYSLTDLVQGLTFKDNRAYVSTSWGTGFSNIYVYDLSKANAGSIKISDRDVPLYELDSAALERTVMFPPMSEQIVFADDKLYTMCESASDKYIFGKFTSARWCYATDISRDMP